MSEKMIQRIQASLLGVQLGDAIGMPVEIMTPEEILEATGGKGVTGPMDCIQTRISDTRGLKSGETTDDWQLTAAVARSLIEQGDHDQHHMARAHIQEYLGDNRGWGGTTKKGIQSLIDGRSPHEIMDPPEPGKGCGNGVAMKIAPLAHFCAARYGRWKPFPLMDWVMEHGKLTHPDLRATIAAYALAAGILRVMCSPLLRNDRPVNKMLRRMSFLEFVWKETMAAEELFNCNHAAEDSVSWRIEQAMHRFKDPVKLREEVGTGCVALESVPFALATFARHYDNFQAGILEAVNAGGDTDSTASMVGALIGANYEGRTDEDWDAFGLPPAWIEALQDKGANACVLGANLHEAAQP